MAEEQFDIKSPDPKHKFTDEQLERFLLFAVAVAGKTAKTIERQINEFLSLEKGASPFQKVRRMRGKKMLLKNLKTAALGQYTKLNESYRQIVDAKLDLRTCTVTELEALHGIGPKTARFFILHTRENQRLAVLDTHILKFLASVYSHETVPTATPSGKAYAYWEEKFLQCADLLKKTPAQLDSEIWYSSSNYKGNGVLSY